MFYWIECVEQKILSMMWTDIKILRQCLSVQGQTAKWKRCFRRMNQEKKMENHVISCMGLSVEHNIVENYSKCSHKTIPVQSRDNRRATAYHHVDIQSRISSKPHSFETSRRAHMTRTNHVEAYMRWSLTRDMIRACASSEFFIFTAVSRGVHVMRAWFSKDSLMTSSWYFSVDSSWSDVLAEICAQCDKRRHAYFFTPGKLSCQHSSGLHLVRHLTRQHILQYFPGASVIHLDSLVRSALQRVHRLIGADARCWLERLTSGPYNDSGHNMHDIQEDYLISAVCADLAVLIRLMHTPAQCLGKCQANS